ncbi:MAG: hypothetical protein COZ43_12095 [Sphingomonadales bacterium CG_4_10_14_3_um_filter_58_15]|nr:MAG: hypothetical protein COZ43_12095 [Sphingomonadales bacterium CG_4_10_14_3_um_filter_58_15]
MIWWRAVIPSSNNPPRDGEVAVAKRLTEGVLHQTPRLRQAPSTILRMVPLPVPGRICNHQNPFPTPPSPCHIP